MDYDFLQNIANVGFPITITIYLLVRMENKIIALTDSINKLTNVIEIIKSDKK
ncbi:YvrJ family protein [Clostridium sp.]|uniref:YvrJ family protein n=1 Tax=Clostridium sp. TaxID=1506 RepID=UPI003F7D12CF